MRQRLAAEHRIILRTHMNVVKKGRKVKGRDSSEGWIPPTGDTLGFGGSDASRSKGFCAAGKGEALHGRRTFFLRSFRPPVGSNQLRYCIVTG